jgi:hypothetical protein
MNVKIIPTDKPIAKDRFDALYEPTVVPEETSLLQLLSRVIGIFANP